MVGLPNVAENKKRVKGHCLNKQESIIYMLFFMDVDVCEVSLPKTKRRKYLHECIVTISIDLNFIMNRCL